MIERPLAQLASELAARREPFVTATVVRVQRPTSAAAGNVAIVHADGTLEGFVGGACAEHSVRLYALESIERGAAMLLRIVPDPAQLDPGTPADAGQEISREEGAVTVRNPCLSGGAIEVFLEPALPAPRVLIAGDSPIAAALGRLGAELGFELVAVAGGRDPVVPTAADLALVVAAHGREELGVLRAAIEAGVPYVGLVASPRRGAAVLEELRAAGADPELVGRIETPAGLAIGARTPAEIALSILARVVTVRRGGRAEPAGASAGLPSVAVDPVCGMSVVVSPDTPSAERGGETFHFCCEGCRRMFEQQAA